MTRTKEEIIQSIIEWFESNDDFFNIALEELDNWNGYLGDNRWYCMDELPELFSDTMEVLRRAYYGDFCPNHDWFSFDGYGNFVSSDLPDYSAYLTEDTIEDMYENRTHIDSISGYDEISEFFDELDSYYNDEDEEKDEEQGAN